jgi:hypothetical protein
MITIYPVNLLTGKINKHLTNALIEVPNHQDQRQTVMVLIHLHPRTNLPIASIAIPLN